MRLLLPILLTLLAACTTPARDANPPPETGDAPDADDTTAMLPAPFPASRIRDAAWVGKTEVYRQRRGAGDWTWRRTVYTAVTPETATFEFVTLDQDGQPVSEPQVSTATWEELEGHAIYPAERTTLRDHMVTVPAGSYAARTYAVRTERDGKSQLVRATFALNRPGPPVRYEQIVDGQRLFLMELVQDPGLPPR